MHKLMVVLMISLVSLAGCLSDSGDSGVDGARSQFKNPIVTDHDHNDPTTHDFDNNMELVGYHPIREGDIDTISEIDIAGGYAFVAEMGVGFHIFDLTDPTDPILVSTTIVDTPDQQTEGIPLAGDVYMADLKVDAVGDWVFVATELSTTPGVLIYDARDKAAPVLAGFWPEPGLLLGCHMIEYAVIDEQEYLFCAPLDNAVYVGLLLPPTGGVREIVQVARWMPANQKFTEQQAAAVQHYAESGDASGLALHGVSGHQDMTYQNDPLTGTSIMSVSFWNLGVRWVDVSNPALPTEVGSWAGEESGHWAGSIHTAMIYESEERRMAAAIPEGAQPPTVFIFDTTDYNSPILVGEWTPKDDDGNNSRFSMHNFQIVGGNMYLAMYHGGIWVLDISDPETQVEPEVLGTFMPFDRRPDTYGRGLNGGIMGWDIVVYNGYTITASQGGFFVTALSGDPLGDENHSSFA